MPARQDAARPSEGKTKIARLRIARDLSQAYLAQWVGMRLTTYQRLETGLVRDPRLSWLVNIAAFLAVPLEEVIEEEWLQWWEPPSPYADDEFERYWGERAATSPQPVRRRVDAPVPLVRERVDAAK